MPLRLFATLLAALFLVSHTDAISPEKDAARPLGLWEIRIQQYVDWQRRQAPAITFAIDDYAQAGTKSASD